MSDHSPRGKFVLTVALVGALLLAIWLLWTAGPDAPACIAIGHMTVAGKCDRE
jgi:hypothetical protein